MSKLVEQLTHPAESTALRAYLDRVVAVVKKSSNISDNHGAKIFSTKLTDHSSTSIYLHSSHDTVMLEFKFTEWDAAEESSYWLGIKHVSVNAEKLTWNPQKDADSLMDSLSKFLSNYYIDLIQNNLVTSEAIEKHLWNDKGVATYLPDSWPAESS